MVAAAKGSRMSRQAGKAKSSDSTLANLATKTTTAAVRAAVPAALTTGLNYTGQYLYDRLIGDGKKEDASKMDVVRGMVQHLDVEQFKKAVADFVGVAKGFRDNAVKAAAPYDKKNPPITVRDTEATLKTAYNHQTVMRVAFGALKFAGDELVKLGGGVDTGYLLMQELGRVALANKGINWDGTKVEAKEVREAKALQREETEAMLEVQDLHPRKPDESRPDYINRIDKLVDKRMAERAAERHTKEVETLAARVRKLAGDEAMLAEVLDLLLAGEAEADSTATADKNLH